jgi:hypothetical protein
VYRAVETICSRVMPFDWLNGRIFVSIIQVTWQFRKVIQKLRNNPFTKSIDLVVTKYSNIAVVYKAQVCFHSQITSNIK